MRSMAVDSHVTRNLFLGEKCATNDAKIATRKPSVPEP